MEDTGLGSFKVNYDGAIFPEQGRAGLGVAIRNSEGAVLASLSQQIPMPATVAQVEALAARKAVEFALEISITSATFEGDSDTVFKELNSSDASLALHGHLIQDFKILIFSLIVSALFMFIGNNVAHSLAR